MKKIIFILALVALTVGVSAQSPFKGFFQPVTADQFAAYGDKALTGKLLVRPEMTIAGNVFKPVFDEAGKFTGIESSFASRLGFGASYSLYKMVEDVPYNVYSFALQLSLATAEKPNMGLLFTASAFDLYGLSPSVGIGYDFIKNSPAKANIFFLWGANVTF